jgi:hypothetical protein
VLSATSRMASTAEATVERRGSKPTGRGPSIGGADRKNVYVLVVWLITPAVRGDQLCDSVLMNVSVLPAPIYRENGQRESLRNISRTPLKRADVAIRYVDSRHSSTRASGPKLTT